MIAKHSPLNLSGEEPVALFMLLVESHKEKMLEFKKTLNPDLLEELQIIQRLIKKVFNLVVDETTLYSSN